MLYIICVATTQNIYLKHLKKSLLSCPDFHNNAKFICLGMGEKWNGFETKIRLVSDFIHTTSFDSESDLIAVIDAYDVLYCKTSILDLIDEFKKKNVDFVLSNNHDSYLDLLESYFFLRVFGRLNCFKRQHTRINAGLMLGRVDAFKYLYSEFENQLNRFHIFPIDDQRILNSLFNDTRKFEFDSSDSTFLSAVTGYNFLFDSELLFSANINGFREKFIKNKNFFFVHIYGMYEMKSVYKIFTTNDNNHQLTIAQALTAHESRKVYTQKLIYYLRAYSHYFMIDAAIISFIGIITVMHLFTWTRRRKH